MVGPPERLRQAQPGLRPEPGDSVHGGASHTARSGLRRMSDASVA